jgi:general secretion pathway protein G
MSLVEVMVVIAIVLTLMSVVAIGVMNVWEQARADTTRVTMDKVGQSIVIRMLKSGQPPADLRSAVIGPHLDGWGREIVYQRPGRDGSAYELVSLGSDGVEGGTGNDEDIVWSPPR